MELDEERVVVRATAGASGCQDGPWLLRRVGRDDGGGLDPDVSACLSRGPLMRQPPQASLWRPACPGAGGSCRVGVQVSCRSA